MSPEHASQYLLSLRGQTGSDDLLQDVIEAAVRYARLRVDWVLLDREGRAALDPTRTAAHNTLIDACNILSRGMLRAGEDATWREALGNDRKVIGDMACHLHCALGVAAR